MELHTKIRLRRWRDNTLFTASILGMLALIYGFFFCIADSHRGSALTSTERHYIASVGMLILLGGQYLQGLHWRWKHRHDEPQENFLDVLDKQYFLGSEAYQHNEPKESNPFLNQEGDDTFEYEKYVWFDGWEDAEKLDGHEYDLVRVVDLNHVEQAQLSAPKGGWTLKALDDIECFAISPRGWRLFLGDQCMRSSCWSRNDEQ